MKYKKELNNFELALGLSESRAKELKSIIDQAYNQHWHKDGPNVDQINAFVAPKINTPEEAFYTAQVIMTDLIGALSS